MPGSTRRHRKTEFPRRSLETGCGAGHRYRDAVTGTVKDIIQYLDDTLDRKYPISGNLTQLYEYFTYELGRVKIGRRGEPLTHVKSMAGELRDAFREAQRSGESGR